MENVFSHSTLSSESKEKSPKEKPENIKTLLWEKMPNLASNLIKTHLDLSDARNQHFAENPDDPKEHEVRWHEWGILTHTQKFAEYYHTQVQDSLEKLGIREKVEKALAEKIGDMSKEELMEIAIIFHDVGKFTARHFQAQAEGADSVSFKNHEKESGKIIRSAPVQDILKNECNLSDEQVEYVAASAELHFELGLVRKAAIKSLGGYNLSFINGPEFTKMVLNVMRDPEKSDFALEIGLMFLADSLAKNEIRIPGNSDKEIANQDGEIRVKLIRRGLPETLVKSVKQLRQNVIAAERYLEIWNQNF